MAQPASPAPPPPPPPPPQQQQQQEQQRQRHPTALPPISPTVLPLDVATTPCPPKVCQNSKCSTATSSLWMPGWFMHSGHIADLCHTCGSAYEHLCFCETFHADDSGWRTCNSCKKRLHCGCIASISFYILLDGGGVECVSCARRNTSYNTVSNSALHLLSFSRFLQKVEGSSIEQRNDDWRARFSWNSESLSLLVSPPPCSTAACRPQVAQMQVISEVGPQIVKDPLTDVSVGEMTFAERDHDAAAFSKYESREEEFGISLPLTGLELLDGERKTDFSKDVNIADWSDPGPTKDICLQGEFSIREMGDGTASDTGRLSCRLNDVEKLEEICDFTGKGIDSGNIESDPSNSACLTMSLGLCPKMEEANEACEQEVPKSFFRQASELEGHLKELDKVLGSHIKRQRQKQQVAKASAHTRTEAQMESSAKGSIRVVRPPGEGRGRNQLLPRYWPRITDQELQQFTSGNSNSMITPLFEKVLSASDAGRIGRLVLPKACAEAYFPAISQPEGQPLKIQDVTGKEWSFQFRFWPNNNSRMYVLEGVTPCIQSMQLQAGDTVTFSRLDPEGKLIMGYRRAPNSMSSQDQQSLTVAGTTPAALLKSGGKDSLNSVSSLLSNVVKCPTEAQSNCLSGIGNISETRYSQCNEKQPPKESTFTQPLTSGDRKRGQHPGSKKKKPRLEVEDSVDQWNLSWEEVQELLRPPPNAAPSIVTVEGHEFEEYEEPPVFGKRTFFCSRPGRPGEEQWAQCDDCGSWRKVPADVCLPTTWTCSDNVWDVTRAACTVIQEAGNGENHKVSRLSKEVKKQDYKETPSGLETLANAATLGENKVLSSCPPPTTKHPRHRPGCTCIVCIQPPSGKGPKHKPTCTCNVCTTVKRRFKTLMMRRKKRQSEQEVENVQKKYVTEEGEVNSETNLHDEPLISEKDSVKGNLTAVTLPCGSPVTSVFPSTSSEIKLHNEALISEKGSVKGNSTVIFPSASPEISTFPSNGDRCSPNANPGSYSQRPNSLKEEHVIGKPPIDLNSQPERDDEQCKGSARVTMTMLFQNANYPLQRYLQQQGISNLVCPSPMINPTMACPENLETTMKDDHSSSQSAVLTSDRLSEDQNLSFPQAKLDTSSIGCLQNLDLIDQKFNIQISSQSS